MHSGITADALTRLMDTLIAIGDSAAINFTGLPDRRKPVFASGVAILVGVFEALKLDKMEISEGALREGLLYDLIGREHDEDIRDNTILAVVQRYSVDVEQAQRVRKAAENFFVQVKDDWGLNKKTDLKLLSWAALIHEIGLSIAHNQYHRHGAYLVGNSDLAGFSRQEQMKLALLVRCHRRKFPLEEFETFPASMRITLIRLCILLRLAVVLYRSRPNDSLPEIKINVENNKVNLHFPPGWFEQHPLTLVDLMTEQGFLQTADFKLMFDE